MCLIVLNICLFFLRFYHAFLSNYSQLNELSMLNLANCFNGANFSELSMLSLSTLVAPIIVVKYYEFTLFLKDYYTSWTNATAGDMF